MERVFLAVEKLFWAVEIYFYAVGSKRNLIWYHPKIVGVRRSELVQSSVVHPPVHRVVGRHAIPSVSQVGQTVSKVKTPPRTWFNS